MERSSAGVSLQQHLHDQLRGMRLSDADRAAVMVLIESLNEDGYLADPLDEIAERLLADAASGDETSRRWPRRARNSSRGSSAR
jgi:RNA polymerase sigma-54 factor